MSLDTYTIGERSYRVLARFNGDDRQAQLKEFLRRTLHAKVVADTGDEIVVISDADKGRPLHKEDDGWNKGWTSLLDGGIRFTNKGA